MKNLFAEFRFVKILNTLIIHLAILWRILLENVSMMGSNAHSKSNVKNILRKKLVVKEARMVHAHTVLMFVLLCHIVRMRKMMK